MCKAGKTVPVVALPFCEGSLHAALASLARKDVDCLPENTREINHRQEPSELASAHGQPVQAVSPGAQIAQGVSGGEGGWQRERRACWLVWDPLPRLPVPRPERPLGRQASEGPQGCFCFVTLSAGGEGGG